MPIGSTSGFDASLRKAIGGREDHMSSDEGGHEQNKRNAADQRTTPIEPDAWLIAFKAFVEEYKRNSAEAERQELLRGDQVGHGTLLVK